MDERETLGSYLKNQRESKKISLREVAKNTRVREYILKAIEEDRYDHLPAATYVKGFLLAYAKYLRLDHNDVLLRYEKVLKGEPIKREPAPPPPTPPPPPKKRTLWSAKQTWVVGGVIVASFILFYFFSPYSSKPLIEPVPEKPIIEEKSPIAPPPPVATTHSVPEKKPFSLQLKAVEETWVSLQVEGQSEKEMTFKPGEGISIQASNKIHIIIGNAGGLDLVLSGKPLDKFGKSGEVVTLTITSQGVEVKRPEKPISQ